MHKNTDKYDLITRDKPRFCIVIWGK